MRYMSMIRLTMILAVTTVFLVGAGTSVDPESKPLRFREIASGVWGLEHQDLTCKGNAHTIEFSDDGTIMTLRYTRGIGGKPPTKVAYRVISEGPGYLRMRMEGEERKTDDGELVVWDLVLLSLDSYCWHRTDWQQGGCTQPAVRCPQIEPGN
jgi:hypothetical protein